MDELKPCPFCGGKTEIVVGLYNSWTDGYAVRCCNCCLIFGAHGRLGEPYEWTCIYESEEEAIKAWNTRHQIPCETCPQIDNPDSFIFHLLQIES